MNRIMNLINWDLLLWSCIIVAGGFFTLLLLGLLIWFIWFIFGSLGVFVSGIVFTVVFSVLIIYSAFSEDSYLF